MTYKILKYPFKALMLVIAIVLLPLVVFVLVIEEESTFKKFCEGIDFWFEKCLESND